METMEKIDIRDLSIGDWVCAEQLCGVHSEPRLTPPMKVVGLGESWVNLEIDPEQGDPFEYEPSEIRGVPITEEVLEKNGYAGAEFSALMQLNNSPIVGKCPIKINHIHELQHILRLTKMDKEIVL